MRIETKDGIAIYCLPDTARCKCNDENPLDMDCCPHCIYDEYGDICVPERCVFYEE